MFEKVKRVVSAFAGGALGFIEGLILEPFAAVGKCIYYYSEGDEDALSKLTFSMF